MAITKSILLRGITVPDAYIRVDRITGGKYAGFQAEAGIYSSPEVAMPIDTVGVSFGFVPGQDLLETGYAALKGLPQFSGSGDC